MKTGEAIYQLLIADANVFAILDKRISPNVAEQGTPNPCATYIVQHKAIREKDSFSTYDDTVIINLFTDTYTELIDLAEKVVTALDRKNYAPQKVTQIDFKDSDESFDDQSNSHQMTQIYTVLKDK